MPEVTLSMYLSGPLTLQERFSLGVLWAIVFGPISRGYRPNYNEEELWYLVDRRTAGRMKAVLESRSWHTQECDTNRDTPEVQGMMAFVETAERTFDEFILSVLEKVSRIEVV